MAAKPLQRPSGVRILGRDYTIAYVDPSPLNNMAVGLCDNHRQAIFVEDYQTPIEEADTTLHETLHGILYTTKVGLDAETEEKVVSALATGLLGVLQDNPQYAAWLIADKSKGA